MISAIILPISYGQVNAILNIVRYNSVNIQTIAFKFRKVFCRPYVYIWLN